MIVRLLRNPAVVLLALVAVVAVFSTAWALGVLMTEQGVSWSGEPSEEQLWALRIIRFADMIAPTATTVAVLAVLGVIIIGAVSSRTLTHDAAEPDRQRAPRSTRTMSAAGSTENRTAVTTPNVSPSISNSWGSPSISSSTERPRE